MCDLWINPFLTGKKNQKNCDFSCLLYFNYLSSCACHKNRVYGSNTYFNNVSTFTIVEICHVISDFSGWRGVLLTLKKMVKTPPTSQKRIRNWERKSNKTLLFTLSSVSINTRGSSQIASTSIYFIYLQHPAGMPLKIKESPFLINFKSLSA